MCTPRMASGMNIEANKVQQRHRMAAELAGHHSCSWAAWLQVIWDWVHQLQLEMHG